MTSRSFSSRNFLLALLALLWGLAVSGCGGGGGSSAGGPSAGAAPPPATATIQLDLDLDAAAAAREVPAEIQHLRITGYNDAGVMIYGPENRGIAPRVVLTNVPVEVTSIRVEFLDKDEEVLGLYVEPEDLEPGETKIITYPDYSDFQNSPLVDRVEVTPPTASVALGLSRDFTAMVVFKDGFRQEVTRDADWSVGNPAIASVSNAPGNKGRAKALAVGATTVSASYAGFPGQASLTVTSAELVRLHVTPATASLPAGRTQQFQATGTFTDDSTADLTGQVTWSSSAPAVATLESTGLATGRSQGGATITATHPGTGKSGTATLTVTAAVLTSIQVSPAAPTVPNGRTQQFTATGTFSDSTTRDVTSQVTWASSAPAIASISNAVGSKGLASTHAQGATVVTGTDPTTGLAATATLTVTTAELVSLAITPTAPSVPLGRTQQLVATGTFSDGTTRDLTAQVLWSSSDPARASISNDPASAGLATTQAAGAATITARDASTGKTGSTTLTVTAAVLVSLSVSPNPVSLPKGRTQQFTATGTYSDATTRNLTSDVTWSTSAENVATISNAAGTKGLATAAGIGRANITATDPTTSVQGTATLDVTAAVLVSLNVTPATSRVPKGLAQQLAATGVYSDATTQDLTAQVTWSSSDATIASVSNATGSQGLVSALAVGGPVAVKAVDPSTRVEASASVEVVAATLASIQVSPTAPTVPLGRTQQFVATGTFSDNTTRDLTAQVLWSSSDPARASISNDPTTAGLATTKATGAVTITARDAGTGKTGSTTLTVTAAVLVSLSVSPNPVSLPKGRTQQFTATGTYSDATTRNLTSDVTWSTSAGNVATISNAAGTKGLATAAGIGRANITATDPTTSVQGTATLDVTAAVLVSLNVTPATSRVPKGLAQQLAATGVYSDATTQDLTAQVTWSSSDATIASVSNATGSQGLVSALAVGGPVAVKAVDPSTRVEAGASVEVVAATLASIVVTPANPSVAKGRTQQFTATGTYSDGTLQDLTDRVAWNSSNASVAGITSAVQGRGDFANVEAGGGLATALALGQTTIRATFPGTSTSGSTTLTVTKAELASLAVTPATASLPRGLTQQFTATATFTDGSTSDLTTTVTWSSSSEAVATIRNDASKGLATAVGQGSATITATDPATSLRGTATLTVTQAALVSVAVTPSNPSVEQGKTRQFTATGTYSDSSTQDLTATVTWSCADTAVATISNAAGSQGLATGVKPGATTISATHPATGLKGQTGLTVTEPSPLQLMKGSYVGTAAFLAARNGMSIGTLSVDGLGNITGGGWSSSTAVGSSNRTVSSGRYGVESDRTLSGSYTDTTGGTTTFTGGKVSPSGSLAALTWTSTQGEQGVTLLVKRAEGASAASLQGAYRFALGVTDGPGRGSALGTLQFDGVGYLSGGAIAYNGGATTSITAGMYSVDSLGGFQATLNLSTGTFLTLSGYLGQDGTLLFTLGDSIGNRAMGVASRAPGSASSADLLGAFGTLGLSTSGAEVGWYAGSTAFNGGGAITGGTLTYASGLSRTLSSGTATVGGTGTVQFLASTSGGWQTGGSSAFNVAKDLVFGAGYDGAGSRGLVLLVR